MTETATKGRNGTPRVDQKAAAVSAPGQVGAASPRLRRRPVAVVLAACLLVLGVLLGVWLWASASNSVAVVLVTHDVQRGQVIGEADLTTARVAVDPAVHTVPADQLAGVVGRRAASDLSAGSLLNGDQVTDAVAPGVGDSVVGIPVVPGLLPAEPLRSGDTVRLVQTPGAGGSVGKGEPATFTATVLQVTPAETQTVVDVVVPSSEAARLAALAATGKVAVVLESRVR